MGGQGFRFARRSGKTSEVTPPQQGETLKDYFERVAQETATPQFRTQGDKISPIGKGYFGEIYNQFKGKAKEAINFLLRKRSGEAIGALFHKDIGFIDLVWGKEGTGKSDGFGLAKLEKYHPEVLSNLQEIIDDMQVVSRSENRINLESNSYKAAVRLTWNNERKNWLLTAYEKRETPASTISSTDVESNPKDLLDDTATQQNANVSTDKVTNNIPNVQEIGEENVKFRVVSEEHIKDKLGVDKLETEKVYRAMQMVDGKLYPPMAGKVNGKWQDEIKLGEWEEAIERPDMVDKKGNFKLDKGNKKSLKARYNPYFHTSRTPLNDQFAEAQSRPNLVTVEVEVPKAELTSGYKAEKAKDAVGLVEWKAGVIQSKLSGKREVILSRWNKPVRVVPDSEVAQRIVEMFDGKEITMPSNVVTPSLRAELEKLGVPFVETDNQGNLIEDVNFRISDKWYDTYEKTHEIISGEQYSVGTGWRSRYYTGQTEDGENYVIRLSDHPANIDNFEINNPEAKLILSIVIADEFSPKEQRQKPITNDDNIWQLVIPSEGVDFDALKDGIDRFKRTGLGYYVGSGTFEEVRFRITPEMQTIKDKAIADGTFMKAPNGKPSNLDERQWLHVRAENFKKWFGDWLKTARIEKLRKSEPIVVEFNNEYELNRDSAQLWIKENLQGNYINKDTKEAISLSRIGRNKVTSHGERELYHLKSIIAIPKLIEDSIFIEEQKNEKGNDKYDSYRYYVCGLKIDGVDYTAKIVIGVKGDSKYYDHRLTEIEKGTLIDNLNKMANPVVENQNTLSEYKDTKLISILQTNSSKVVDANGEPKVVWHQTNAEFNEFSRENARKNLELDGFFFAPEYDPYGEYGERATENNGGYSEGNNDIRFRVAPQFTAPTFVSNAQRAVQSIKQEKGAATRRVVSGSRWCYLIKGTSKNSPF